MSVQGMRNWRFNYGWLRRIDPRLWAFGAGASAAAYFGQWPRWSRAANVLHPSAG
jgi:hypothetical protein